MEEETQHSANDVAEILEDKVEAAIDNAVAEVRDDDALVEKVLQKVLAKLDENQKKTEEKLEQLAEMEMEEQETASPEIPENESEVVETTEEESEDSYDVKPRRSHKLFYRPMRRKDE